MNSIVEEAPMLKAVQAQPLREGCGSLLEIFEADALGRKMQAEINRAAAAGLTRLTLTMDLPDAVRLAAYLRKRG